MKSMLNSLQELAMGSLLAMCLNAGLANAQTVAGNFTLPFAAHWGQATLPAGNYSFLMERGQGAKVQILRAGKPVAFVVEQGYHSSGRATSAWLAVERTSAGNTVRELSMPSIGKVLHYAPNKPQRNSATEERQIAQLIPITTAAN